MIGRDARLSGNMIQNLVVNTLIGLGIDVLDLAIDNPNSRNGCRRTPSARWNYLDRKS